MNDARSAILDAVRAATAFHRAARAPFEAPADHIRPARATGDRAGLQSRFCEMARFAGADVARLEAGTDVPSAVSALMSREGLGDRLVLSPDRRLADLPWHASPRLVVRRGRPTPDDRVSVTGVVAAVAETGTLLVRSGPDIANTLHLLPEFHIAVVPASAVVGSYEEGLDRLQQSGALPRAATFITGPSRTADIEKTPQIGVHGPKRLHILLVDE